jgi:hypothetical protein
LFSKREQGKEREVQNLLVCVICCDYVSSFGCLLKRLHLFDVVFCFRH